MVDDYFVSAGLQWTSRKIGKIVTLYQRELFKKIPRLATFCTQSVNERLRTSSWQGDLNQDGNCFTSYTVSFHRDSGDAIFTITFMWSDWGRSRIGCHEIFLKARQQFTPSMTLGFSITVAVQDWLWTAYTAVRCTGTGNMWRVRSGCSARRPPLKG